MPHNTRFMPEFVANSVFIAPGAVIVGDVSIGENSSVWFQAVLRGDTESIRIGCGSNVQDGCVLHADAGFPCVLGDRVTLGHGAIVHGAQIDDDVMIGMRAVVMNGAKVGAGSLVAVGAVVTEGTEIPPGSVVMGVPAKVKRAAGPHEQQIIQHAADHYVHAAKDYRADQEVPESGA